MTVRDYYAAHFGELSEAKKYHFAARMVRWFHLDEFKAYLAENEPSHDLAAVLENNDYSRVRFYEERKPYFEKYEGLYGLEAALFRVLNLLVDYGVDLREDFLKIYGRERLYGMCDALREDTEAFLVLTTYAVNVIALCEELYPRGIDVYGEMLETAFAGEQNEMSIYLYTHFLLCESRFYTKKVENHLEEYRRAMAQIDEIIESGYESVSLDMKFEFLVCAKMVGYTSRLEARIREEAKANLDGYVRDPAAVERLNTLDGAEHRNVLYIMSGLDGS
jgi:hypothetical protein